MKEIVHAVMILKTLSVHAVIIDYMINAVVDYI